MIVRFRLLLVDYSKAFGYIDHNKLFERKKTVFTNRQQRVKINDVKSEIIKSVCPNEEAIKDLYLESCEKKTRTYVAVIF